MRNRSVDETLVQRDRIRSNVVIAAVVHEAAVLNEKRNQSVVRSVDQQFIRGGRYARKGLDLSITPSIQSHDSVVVHFNAVFVHSDHVVAQLDPAFHVAHAHHLRFGVAGSAAAQLAERLQIIDGHLREEGGVENVRRSR